MAKQRVLDILIVDDELDIPLALSLMLRELAEVNISVVVDGQEAMDALTDTKFDLLFLDLHLPIVTGEKILGIDRWIAGEAVPVFGSAGNNRRRDDWRFPERRLGDGPGAPISEKRPVLIAGLTGFKKIRLCAGVDERSNTRNLYFYGVSGTYLTGRAGRSGEDAIARLQGHIVADEGNCVRYVMDHF